MAKSKKGDAYQPGDIVRLKSGGPNMTVIRGSDLPIEEETYECKWFAGSKLSTGRFSAASLMRVDDKDGQQQ